ncbi:MAG: UDP-N-acetylmuramoyl-L-alanyl-D-glutamate--2,6-diaminopimelate ligase, partial [Bacteroidales bacterium]|nr:UDP-N-acetylmuramoyl-L-alanyl-D-glutamate--2,6-diaminopimelate ligase [Bacteroidales bacterium]
MLHDILYGFEILNIIGDNNIRISSVEFDSRQIAPDSLFVAVKGTQVDGHIFISKVIESGCKAIVCETLPNSLMDGITYIIVKNTSEALGFLASNFFNNPSSDLILVGVTGTNGKTTIVSLLY